MKTINYLLAGTKVDTASVDAIQSMAGKTLKHIQENAGENEKDETALYCDQQEAKGGHCKFTSAQILLPLIAVPG